MHQRAELLLSVSGYDFDCFERYGDVTQSVAFVSALAHDTASLGLNFFWLSCRTLTRMTRPSLFDFVAQKNFSSTQSVCFIMIASKYMKHERVNPKLYTTKGATSRSNLKTSSHNQSLRQTPSCWQPQQRGCRHTSCRFLPDKTSGAGDASSSALA